MSRGGRDKSFADHRNRFEEKDRRTRVGIAPPSRQLWVGNLNPHVSQNAIPDQFSRFGRIDNISYMPGRNYAFVAMRGVQGSILAGCHLRIEFAKWHKCHVEEYALCHADIASFQLIFGTSICRGDSVCSASDGYNFI